MTMGFGPMALPGSQPGRLVSWASRPPMSADICTFCVVAQLSGDHCTPWLLLTRLVMPETIALSGAALSNLRRGEAAVRLWGPAEVADSYGSPL